jgi:hypothetical protein
MCPFLVLWWLLLEALGVALLLWLPLLRDPGPVLLLVSLLVL